MLRSDRLFDSTGTAGWEHTRHAPGTHHGLVSSRAQGTQKAHRSARNVWFAHKFLRSAEVLMAAHECEQNKPLSYIPTRTLVEPSWSL
jgi:hypothetical protein